MLLLSFTRAMKRLIKRLINHKDYDMVFECLKAMQYWKINDHLEDNSKSIGADNVEAVKIERNIYRFVDMVRQICLPIVLELTRCRMLTLMCQYVLNLND